MSPNTITDEQNKALLAELERLKAENQKLAEERLAERALRAADIKLSVHKDGRAIVQVGESYTNGFAYHEFLDLLANRDHVEQWIASNADQLLERDAIKRLRAERKRLERASSR